MNPDPKPKTPRSQKYLEWLKTQRCAVCGRAKHEYRDIVPAHQTIDRYGYMGGKANDFHALPVCSFCHAEGHWHGEKTLWDGYDRKKLIIEHLIKFIQDGMNAR